MAVSLAADLYLGFYAIRTSASALGANEKRRPSESEGGAVETN